MTAADVVSRTWRDLIRRHDCDAGSAQNVLEKLFQAYAEPHRHYHTLSHIANLLHLLLEHGGASSTDAVKLAVLFHDVVYEPARQDNETASANLAAAMLTSLGFPAQLLAKVEHYILATQHGAPLPAADKDLHLLLDLDLSVLASLPDRYRAYAQAIRQEYAAVPDELYRSGRRRVLEGFLARRHIYLCQRLRTLWEARARTNLANEIAELR